MTARSRCGHNAGIALARVEGLREHALVADLLDHRVGDAFRDHHLIARLMVGRDDETTTFGAHRLVARDRDLEVLVTFGAMAFALTRDRVRDDARRGRMAAALVHAPVYRSHGGVARTGLCKRHHRR